LHDVIELKKSDDITIEISNNTKTPVPPGKDNLAFKAAEKILNNLNKGLHIRVEKNIPAGSGLGGGSADAAAVIVGANKIYDLGLGADTLSMIASDLGSDIPFFIHGGCALISGTGEKVKPLRHSLHDSDAVIIKSAISISTSDAYKKLDESSRIKKINDTSCDEILKCVEEKNIECLNDKIFNDFEPLLDEYPEIIEIKKAAKKIGLKFFVTGSGSALFGFLRSYGQRNQIVNSLSRFADVYFVKFADESLKIVN
jgi:4-diphosphocytidyl-2-C-methyl-D-erythritol kinase